MHYPTLVVELYKLEKYECNYIVVRWPHEDSLARSLISQNAYHYRPLCTITPHFGSDVIEMMSKSLKESEENYRYLYIDGNGFTEANDLMTAYMRVIRCSPNLTGQFTIKVLPTPGSGSPTVIHRQDGVHVLLNNETVAVIPNPIRDCLDIDKWVLVGNVISFPVRSTVLYERRNHAA